MTKSTRLWFLTYEKRMRQRHSVSLMKLNKDLTKSNNKKYYVTNVGLYLWKLSKFEIFIFIHCQSIISSLKGLKFFIWRLCKFWSIILICFGLPLICLLEVFSVKRLFIIKTSTSAALFQHSFTYSFFLDLHEISWFCWAA